MTEANIISGEPHLLSHTPCNTVRVLRTCLAHHRLYAMGEQPIPFRILRLTHPRTVGSQECFYAFPSNLAGGFSVMMVSLHMEKCA